MSPGGRQGWRRGPEVGKGCRCAPAPRVGVGGGNAGKAGAGGKKPGWFARGHLGWQGGKADNGGKKALASGVSSGVQ
jgi:hypothetical protein